jgi:hypothetical protein
MYNLNYDAMTMTVYLYVSYRTHSPLTLIMRTLYRGKQNLQSPLVFYGRARNPTHSFDQIEQTCYSQSA